jgi:hypothetical protein
MGMSARIREIGPTFDGYFGFAPLGCDQIGPRLTLHKLCSGSSCIRRGCTCLLGANFEQEFKKWRCNEPAMF